MTRAPSRVLLLGGTSEIGLATLRALQLHDDDAVLLAGRHPDAMRAAGDTLAARVSVAEFDACAAESRRRAVSEAFAAGPVDLLLAAFGILGEQDRAEREPGHTEDVLEVDFVAQAGILHDAAARMLAQGHGTLVVFSSVAAVRPRRPNYVYGSAKAGLDAFARGLADRLHGSGVHLLLVRPGFVVGRMTAGMPRAPLSSTPEQVGEAVARALATGRSEVWVPPALRALATLMRLVPRPLWRRVPR